MITLHQYLTTFAEAMPGWLKAYRPAACSPSEIMGDFMRSRLVYYPGSGNDGHPVAAFNKAHAAHCYIYVDYLTERVTLLDQLQDTGFLGYHSLDRVDISEIALARGRWTPHAPPQRYPFNPVKPYRRASQIHRNIGPSEVLAASFARASARVGAELGLAAGQGAVTTSVCNPLGPGQNNRLDLRRVRRVTEVREQRRQVLGRVQHPQDGRWAGRRIVHQ